MFGIGTDVRGISMSSYAQLPGTTGSLTTCLLLLDHTAGNLNRTRALTSDCVSMLSLLV